MSLWGNDWRDYFEDAKSALRRLKAGSGTADRLNSILVAEESLVQAACNNLDFGRTWCAASHVTDEVRGAARALTCSVSSTGP